MTDKTDMSLRDQAAASMNAYLGDVTEDIDRIPTIGELIAEVERPAAYWRIWCKLQIELPGFTDVVNGLEPKAFSADLAAQKTKMGQRSAARAYAALIHDGVMLQIGQTSGKRYAIARMTDVIRPSDELMEELAGRGSPVALVFDATGTRTAAEIVLARSESADAVTKSPRIEAAGREIDATRSAVIEAAGREIDAMPASSAPDIDHGADVQLVDPGARAVAAQIRSIVGACRQLTEEVDVESALGSENERVAEASEALTRSIARLDRLLPHGSDAPLTQADLDAAMAEIERIRAQAPKILNWPAKSDVH